MVGAEPILVLAVVDGHLDRHAGVDQPDQRRGDPDVRRVAPITGAGEPGDVGGEATADDQNGFGATQPELVERTDDPLERRQRLRGLPDLHRHHGQRDAVVAEVAVDLLGDRGGKRSRRPPSARDRSRDSSPRGQRYRARRHRRHTPGRSRCVRIPRRRKDLSEAVTRAFSSLIRTDRSVTANEITVTLVER